MLGFIFSLIKFCVLAVLFVIALCVKVLPYLWQALVFLFDLVTHPIVLWTFGVFFFVLYVIGVAVSISEKFSKGKRSSHSSSGAGPSGSYSSGGSGYSSGGGHGSSGYSSSGSSGSSRYSSGAGHSSSGYSSSGSSGRGSSGSSGSGASSVPQGRGWALALFSLNASASQAEIRSRYHELVRANHPDRLPPSATDAERCTAERKMADILKAYKLLSAS